jgi:DNA-binding NarL/FixJ family response regulator
MAKGYTNHQIARVLMVSTSTVKNHVRHVLAMLGASDRTQAAIMALESGPLSGPPSNPRQTPKGHGLC